MIRGTLPALLQDTGPCSGQYNSARMITVTLRDGTRIVHHGRGDPKAALVIVPSFLDRLRMYRRDFISMSQLRKLARSLRGSFGIPQDDDAVLAEIASFLNSGLLVWETTPIVPRPIPTPGPGKAGSAVRTTARRRSTRAKPKPVPKEPVTTWIEIALLGEDGSPIGGEKYRLKLPNGRVVDGVLPSSGKVRVDGIPPGDCSVSFPDLDMDAWDPI